MSIPIDRRPSPRGRVPALVAPLVVALAGCSAYWPLSDDIEERIRAETASLSPSIGEDDAVRRIGEEAASGDLAPPEAFPLPPEPALEDYVRFALERNPRIRAMVRDVEAMGLRVPQVTSLDDPMLTFVPPTGDMTQTAGGMMDASVGISQKVPFPSKLAARGRVAEQVVRIALENLRATRLDVVADVKQAYYGYYLTGISVRVAREHIDLLRRIRDVAAAKFRAGIAPQQDVLRAEVELYQLSNELLTLEQEVRTARAALNVLIDRGIEAELPPPSPFDAQRVEWELETLMARAVAASPELQTLRETVRRDLEAGRLARLDYLPDFSVGGAYSFIGGGISPVADGSDAWNLTLGMTLPVWFQRIRAGILQRNAEILGSALRYRSRRNDVFVALQDALVRVDIQYRRALLFRDAILPRARQAVEVSESGYQSGQLDFLTWIDNWRRLIEFTLEYHRALAGLEQSFALLEQLAGGELPRAAPQPRPLPETTP